jgi:hypothetical protein
MRLNWMEPEIESCGRLGLELKPAQRSDRPPELYENIMKTIDKEDTGG